MTTTGTLTADLHHFQKGGYGEKFGGQKSSPLPQGSEGAESHKINQNMGLAVAALGPELSP